MSYGSIFLPTYSGVRPNHETGNEDGDDHVD